MGYICVMILIYIAKYKDDYFIGSGVGGILTTKNDSLLSSLGGVTIPLIDDP